MLKVIIPKENLIIAEYTSSRATKIGIDSTLGWKVVYSDTVSYAVGSTRHPAKYVYHTHTGMLDIITNADLLFITDVTVNFYSSGYLRDAKLDRLLH